MTLRLGERKFACDLVSVQEIVLYPEISSRAGDSGIYIGSHENARGTIPVIDLLGRPIDSSNINYKVLIIIGQSTQTIGLLIDELLENVSIPISSVLPLPDGAYGVDIGFLKGVIEFEEETYYLIDLERVAKAWQDEWHPAGKGTTGTVGSER